MNHSRAARCAAMGLLVVVAGCGMGPRERSSTTTTTQSGTNAQPRSDAPPATTTGNPAGTPTGTIDPAPEQTAVGERVLGKPYLRGNIGHVEGIDDAATLEQQAWDANWTILNVYVRAQQGVALSMVAIEGTLDHPALVPGAHLRFSPWDDNPAAWDMDPATLYAWTMGCSDPDRDADLSATEYDEEADEVVIDVSEGDTPGTRIFTVRSTFWADDVTGTPHAEAEARFEVR